MMSSSCGETRPAPHGSFHDIFLPLGNIGAITEQSLPGTSAAMSGFDLGSEESIK
jgi:hypothetical protein